MNLYLITFQSSLNRIESVYDCHKDLFVKPEPEAEPEVEEKPKRGRKPKKKEDEE